MSTIHHYQASHSVALLAAEDGPVTGSDRRRLLDEAGRIAAHVSATTPRDLARLGAAEVVRLVRRLGADDVDAVRLLDWAGKRGATLAGVCPAPVAPVEPEAPHSDPPVADAPRATAADLVAASVALDEARAVAAGRERDAAEAHAARDTRKATALDTDAPEAWEAYHQADRRALELDARAARAREALDLATAMHARITGELREVEFGEAARAAGDEAFAALLADAVPLRRDLVRITKALEQAVFRAVFVQNERARAALSVAKSIGLSDVEARDRLSGRSLSPVGGMPFRSVADAQALLVELADAEVPS